MSWSGKGVPGMGLVDVDIYHLNRRQKVAYLTNEGAALRDRIAYSLGVGNAGI